MTTNVTVGREWVQVADDGDWQLLSLADTSRQTPISIEVATSAGAPAAAFRGHQIDAGNGITFRLLGEGDVWARTMPGALEEVTVVIS